MSYKSKNLREIILDIEGSKVFLPALQRKFVWNRDQIEILFDSLMRNYPIGTFLFWKLNREVANQYAFYEFLREFDQRSPYNRRKTGGFLYPEITGVLDGQQRLSSLYIGLQGTHTEKAPYMRWADDKAYKKAHLYLNLLSLPYYVDSEDNLRVDEEKNFEFRFLTLEDVNDWTSRPVKDNENKIQERPEVEFMLWYKVGDIMKLPDDPEYDKVVDEISKKASEGQKLGVTENRRQMKKALEVLYNRITKDQVINYFEVSRNDLEDILKIFIRVNSGGTQLNKTDLLFSTIVATWDDGREEIETLLKKINGKGQGFTFSNEYLMRACLMLADAPVLFKVNSFKPENVDSIRKEWPVISVAILRTVDLLVEFGYDGTTLTSQNATIIISYFIYKGGVLDDDGKRDIRKYLVHALLSGIYGSSQDQLLATLRNHFRKAETDSVGRQSYSLRNNKFSFEDLLNLTLPSRKSLYLSETDIENFLSYKKSAASFSILVQLYPHFRFREIQFHQDHIHPASGFTPSALKAMGLSDEKAKEWIEIKDMLPNLQLMEGRTNESKNAMAFKKWLAQRTETEQDHFKITNFIPADISLEFEDFKEFYNVRRTLLKTALLKVLAVNSATQVSNVEYLEQQVDVEG